MRHSKLAIHSENILPIIKKWLYTDKDIFIRELVSNATDALSKRKALQGPSDDLAISITIDKKAKTVTISDTGIGMTEEEVEKYIAQIAFSSAEDFVTKYKDSEPMIGHFGLGFYSAYMVASKVDIETLSHLPDAKPVFWSCDGSSSYSIGPGSRTSRGTSIILHLNDLEYLEEAKLKELLLRTCSFMPFPIELEGKPLHNKLPLWLKSPADCTDKEYLEFHRSLYPLDPDPLLWIHLNVDYPFHLQGILYFPKMQRRFDANERAVRLYCNRVFVSDNCKDILPDYLMPLCGAIDSPDIPLNVSRSSLQLDQHVRQLSSHISKKVSDRIVQLYKSDRERCIQCWEDIETIVKLGILQDEKFYDRVKEALIWKNSDGAWTTLAEYLERASEKKVYYAASSHSSSLLQLYREKQIEILIASSPIDIPLIQHLEHKLSTSFQRIDGALGSQLLDPTREKTLLDSDGKTEASRLAEAIRSSLGEQELTVEAKSLASDVLPALLILDENERRLRDYFALTQNTSLPKSGKKTFVVNTNNKLVQAIGKLHPSQPELAQKLTRSLYDLSRLSQRELEPAEVEGVIAHQTKLLEALTEQVPL